MAEGGSVTCITKASKGTHVGYPMSEPGVGKFMDNHVRQGPVSRDEC